MIYIASDHSGVELKAMLIQYIKSTGFEVIDDGPFSDDSVDYPDYADLVCNRLKTDATGQGILICGSGIGMSIAANRYSEIRAALCHSDSEVKLARKHNDANVLCLGARVISFQAAIDCVEAFLMTNFEGMRHTARVNKLNISRPPANNQTDSLKELISIEKDAISFGFDWPNHEMAIDQIISECAEVKDALNNKESIQRIQEETSDLLHAVISLCMYLGFGVDETLSIIVKKFGDRMKILKSITANRGLESLRGQSIEFMLELWSEAKKNKQNSSELND